MFRSARGCWESYDDLTFLSMNEDTCRIRQKNSTENLAMVRHIALNILKNIDFLKVELKESINKRIEVTVIGKRLCQDFL
ncbi:MAG: hypothetical protein ACJAXN_001597 [Psychromonas sp.]|jgi:hypothetical protein